jgi:hypothetical protein
MEQKKQLPKKEYQRPQLIVYGEIRDATQAVGMMGTDDGGKGMDKTQ